jgi:hypothetical protein
MKQQRIILWIGILVLIGLLPLLVSRALTGPGRPELSEFQGLRETPNIPLGSIILRRHFPEHPSVPLQPGSGGGCDKDVDLTGTISGVVAVAAQNNKICTTADIDTYIAGTKTYVVQAGGEKAAWIHTDVSNPSSPVLLGSFKWGGSSTYTPDVKTFSQTRTVDGNETTGHFINLSLERSSSGGSCGVVIVDVTDTSNPILVTQIYKNDPDDFWCDVHNSFVEDIDGEGRYIYLTADYPNDMRVLDIGNLSSVTVGSTCDIADGTCPITEVGRYISPTANNSNYVHDITVINHGGLVGRRAYLAYWNTGVVILNAEDVTPGGIPPDTNPIPIVGPNELDPSNFLAHHSFASWDGTLVFTQDEFLNVNEPVQMWDVSDPTNPMYVDGLKLGYDVPVNPAHNLEIKFDIEPNRIYVGWYKLGLQAWDFTNSGFVRPNAPPRTAVQYHQVQTESSDDEYSGAWGVRLETIGDDVYIFQSDRFYGLIVDKVVSSCTSDTDCDDANECTTDTCESDGSCSNTAVANDTPCNAGTGLCCGGLCTTPVCEADADCDDGEVCTTDSCLTAGSCSAACSSVWPVCGLDDGCCGPDCDSSDSNCSTCFPKGTSCSSDSKCCSGKCRGKPGAKTCK